MIIIVQLGFFNKIYNKFKVEFSYIPVVEINVVELHVCPIFVTYVGETAVGFVKALSQLSLKQFDVKVIPLYCTNKVGQYFQTKSATLWLYAQMSFTILIVLLIRT